MKRIAKLAVIALCFGCAASAAEPWGAPEPAKSSPTLAVGEGFAPRRPWMGDACKQEFTTPCGSLPVNSKRADIVQCLKTHPDELSRDCQAAIADRQPAAGRFASQGQGGRHHGGGRRGGAGGGGSSNPASTASPDSTSEATRIFGEP